MYILVSSIDSRCSYDDLLDAYEYGARRLANLCVDMLNKREQMGDTPERAWLNTHILLCKMARVTKYLCQLQLSTFT